MVLNVIFFALLGWASGVFVNWLTDWLCARHLDDAFSDEACRECVLPKSFRVYLLGWRACPACGRRRWRYPVVNLAYIAISLWLGLTTPPEMPYLVGLLLMIFFGVITVIDVEYRLILHPVSWAGALLGLAFGVWRRGLWLTLLGGAVGFGAMLSLYLFGILFARVMARWRGEALDEVALGFGDVNFAGILGLLLGWPGVVGGVVLAVLLGGAFSLLYLVGMLVIERRYRAFAAIPYGPFLVASAIILLFMQNALWLVWPYFR